MKKAAVIGAGVTGSLLALRLVQENWQVTLYDNSKAGQQNCSAVAAGMLAPVSEMETSELIIYELGIRSLELWPQILKTLKKPTFFRIEGSLIVAHAQDLAELNRFYNVITTKLKCLFNSVQILNKFELHALEPELNFNSALYLSNEGQIDNQQLLINLSITLNQMNTKRYQNVEVDQISPYKIRTVDDHYYDFDLVCDCRGMGAKTDIEDLRGVRGEIITLHAPHVKITRPVRVMHPRYKIYIVPRPNQYFIIGATEIENDDLSPISVQSSLELLSAAYVTHKGFAESRIVQTATNSRPTFPDNLPKIHYEPGLIRINGLYRHGYLIAPALIENAMQQIRKNL